MTSTISVEPGYLKIVVSGEFSLEAAKNSFLDILESIAQYRSDKVLVDGRLLTGEPKDIERFFYGKFAAELVATTIVQRLHLVPRFAYVLAPPVLDDHNRFGETVAVNRGMRVRTFKNPADAIEWLNEAPAGL
jgi:hypothetical protein